MEALYQACCELPCDLNKIEQMLKSKHYTPEELTQTILRLMDQECFIESHDFIDVHGRKPERGELHTHYLYDLLRIFLAFGLNPNEIQDGDNVMSSLGYVGNGYDAANCLRLLLEHGGDPNLVVDYESNYDYLSFRISYDMYEYDQDYIDTLVHLWFVASGYGGRYSSGIEPLEMKNGHSIEELRTHEQFAYFIEPWPDKPSCWTMHIIRKETGEEIAVF